MKQEIKSVALSVRTLTMDAVQKANSGHPGLPMGCAELGALIFGEILKHTPRDPGWIDRDRFVLSAGHGSMLLYSLLHLSGYDLSLDDIKNFRQLHSKTPGHPENRLTPGVETTTGPLGQGVANAVGMAIAESFLAARFNTRQHTVIDHYTYVLAGDGCLMEGVSAEAASLAGHLGLGKLIVFYDSNKITIDGSTDITFTEDVLQRFEAYGWQTLAGSAYDTDEIMALVNPAKQEQVRPSLILLRSKIAKGSPNLEGSHKAHGSPLGAEEVALIKKTLGIAESDMFYAAPEAKIYFNAKQKLWDTSYAEWQQRFKEWKKSNPDLFDEWKKYFNGREISAVSFPSYNVGDKIATRSSGGEILNATAQALPNLIGGSADLAGSNKTELKGLGSFQKHDRTGRNINFGVREHAMGAVVNGIMLHGGFRVFCATFLVFSDYMRPAVRLAALMQLPVLYIFTHDSIFVGEDGPTHQPVEHVEALRTIPNLRVMRPADAQENVELWKLSLKHNSGPCVMAYTRQNLTVFEKSDPDWKENIKKGAYVVMDSGDVPDVVLIATGSEVGLALEAAHALEGLKVRVVSMPCRELFLQAAAEYREQLVPSASKKVVVEAGVSSGWHVITGGNGAVIGVDRFGESGPASKVAEHLGLSVQNIVKKVKEIAAG
ncbi:MAG: transketolase [Spirochaetales bacterium]|nr:transketolase [Spirochaetales bacterium]